VAPPQKQARPGRQIAFLGLLFVILYALVFFSGTGGMSWRERLEPKLGLDLVGGSRVVLEARTFDGGPPPADSLEQARRIIENRVNGLGVSEAEVVTEGDRNIVISVPGQNNDAIREVGQPAELRFRKVINATTDTGGVVPTPAPSGSASPGPSGSATPTPSASASPSGSPSPSPSASASGSSAPGATPSATPSATAAPRPAQADVERKVGKEAWDAAMALTAPVDLAKDPAQAERLAPFKDLTPLEVDALPTNIQFNVPYITCEKLNDRPAGSIAKPDEQAVACEGSTKYLLDVAKVLGTDVTDATAGINPQTGEWVVNLDFTSDGQERWTKLSQEAVSNTAEPRCQQTGDEGKCLVAIVLDNEVISAPEFQDVMTSSATIRGSFTKSTAQVLAGQLRYGALPLTFEQRDVATVTATLGADHLRAGLLAAAIGMLLVIIYAFFYYRLLGSVIFLSLVLSALLTFGMLVFLGREISFTLTLAGIAGFVVSLGVAADSFVIYFERLKDEIRDGRSPRSAVPRAWARARRTIISANAITIMAAVVLYLVSVGQVKGFAFALGLATLLDLIVVFLFRHPIMTLFARTRAFLSPRVSGLGRVLENAAADERPGSRSARVVKEA
jgi:preprotein translocase subunit SecD